MMKILKAPSALMLVVLLLNACVASTVPEKTGGHEPTFSLQGLKGSDFGRETKKLQQTIRDSKIKNSEKAEAHRRLAILYLATENPERNPQKALVEMAKFIELAPEKLDKAETADWVTALKLENKLQELKEKNLELMEQSALVAKKNRELATSEARLAEDNRRLNATNNELTQTIEKIKKLDLSLEQKKRRLLR